VTQLILVLRCHEDHIGKTAEICEVEHTVMGSPIFPHETGTVHRENDGEFLDTDVMDHLVVGLSLIHI
jgi:hypothetical protein